MIIVGIHLYGALSIALAEARYASKKMQVYRPSTDKKPGHYLIHSNFRGRPFLVFMERLLKLERTQNKVQIRREKVLFPSWRFDLLAKKVSKEGSTVSEECRDVPF